MSDSKGSSSTSSSPLVSSGMRAVFSGVSGVGTTIVTHPMDVVKNRMQLTGEGKRTPRATAYQTLRTILNKHGLFALYAGLSAGILRQVTYTTTRLFVYGWLFELFSGPNREHPSFLTKTAIGMVAGLAGAFAGTPSDIALIRMTADNMLPHHERRRYTNIFNALVRIRREEGITALWRGAVPTMGRAMIVNVAQLVGYSQSKELLLEWKYFEEDKVPVQFCASLFSGFLTTVASMPVDLVKTRLQNMKNFEYRNSRDVLYKTVRNEGFFSLWKGFLPYFAKQAPITVLMFLFLEQINICYIKHFLGHSDEACEREEQKFKQKEEIMTSAFPHC